MTLDQLNERRSLLQQLERQALASGTAGSYGRHRQMAGIANDLLDECFPFLMEKPMGISAAEVDALAAKAARLDAFAAVPLAASIARP